MNRNLSAPNMEINKNDFMHQMNINMNNNINNQINNANNGFIGFNNNFN